VHPILSPRLSFDKDVWTKLGKSQKEAEFTVIFNCFDTGTSSVVVSLMVEDEGKIEFIVRKQCAADPAASQMPEIAEIEGLVIGVTPKGSEVAMHGRIEDAFDWSRQTDKLEDLYVLEATDNYVSFYLRHDTEVAAMPLAFNAPQLISGEELAEVDLTGPLSRGGVLDANHPTASLSLTFHCIDVGTALYTLVLPLTEYVEPKESEEEELGYYDAGNQDYDGYEEYGYYGRRLLEGTDGDVTVEDDENITQPKKHGQHVAVKDKVLRITFMKKCQALDTAALSAGDSTGLGGLYMPGFDVCTTRDCAEGTQVVNNGFPTAKWFGQKNLPREQRSWDVLPNTTTASFFYFMYSPEVPDTGSEVVNKKVSSMYKNAALDLEPLTLVKNGLYADPELKGNVARGGMLRNGRAKGLTIAWNCEYEGLAIATVVIEIIPQGTITFSQAKMCGGKDYTPGVPAKGLKIGTAVGLDDVVKDGSTQSKFQKFVAGDTTSSFVEYGDSTTFYLQGPVEALRGEEPFVFAHRPVVTVDLDHDFHMSEGDADDDSDDAKLEIVLDSKQKTLKVAYTCVFPGKTAVSLAIPILPKGMIAFHWTKDCSADAYNDYYTGYASDYAEENGYENYGGGDYGDFDQWDETHWNPDMYASEPKGAKKDGSLGYVNVGLLPTKLTNVVEKGTPLPSFSMPDSSEGNSHTTILKSNVDTISFFLSIPSGTRATLLLHCCYSLVPLTLH
jgi:hypothetical protein